MQVLNKKKNIEIRGCHSSLYLVELPPSLPSEVIHHLLQRFKHFAKAEVTTMMQVLSQPKTRHRHAPSGESVAVIFSDSESSDSEEEEDDYAYGSPPDSSIIWDDKLFNSL